MFLYNLDKLFFGIFHLRLVLLIRRALTPKNYRISRKKLEFEFSLWVYVEIYQAMKLFCCAANRICRATLRAVEEGDGCRGVIYQEVVAYSINLYRIAWSQGDNIVSFSFDMLEEPPLRIVESLLHSFKRNNGYNA